MIEQNIDVKDTQNIFQFAHYMLKIKVQHVLPLRPRPNVEFHKCKSIQMNLYLKVPMKRKFFSLHFVLSIVENTKKALKDWNYHFFMLFWGYETKEIWIKMGRGLGTSQGVCDVKSRAQALSSASCLYKIYKIRRHVDVWKRSIWVYVCFSVK